MYNDVDYIFIFKRALTSCSFRTQKLLTFSIGRAQHSEPPTPNTGGEMWWQRIKKWADTTHGQQYIRLSKEETIRQLAPIVLTLTGASLCGLYFGNKIREEDGKVLRDIYRMAEEQGDKLSNMNQLMIIIEKNHQETISKLECLEKLANQLLPKEK